MAGPITWRTVMGASLSEASRPMEAAQRAIQGGISGLQSLVEQGQEIAQNGIDRTNEANVQAFLDRLQGARTLEEVAALQQSGALDPLKAALAPKDLARVRGAEDARAATLMQQITAKNTFEAQQAAAKAAPIKDQALSLYMTGDPQKQAQARALLEANPGIPQADVMRAMVEFDAAKSNRDTQAALNPLRVEEAQLNIKNSRTNAAYTEEQRKQLADQRVAMQEQARLAAERQLLVDTGNVYADGLYDPNDSADLMKLMADTGIGDDAGERQAIIKRLSKLAEMEVESLGEDGKVVKRKVPLPKSLVRQAILGSSDQWVNMWNQGFANSMEKNLRDALKVSRDSAGRLRNPVVEDFDRMMTNRLGVSQLPPVLGKPPK